MDLAESLAYAKSGFDLLRSAIGLAKDVQGVLPAGEKKDAMGDALIPGGTPNAAPGGADHSIPWV